MTSYPIRDCGGDLIQPQSPLSPPLSPSPSSPLSKSTPTSTPSTTPTLNTPPLYASFSTVSCALGLITVNLPSTPKHKNKKNKKNKRPMTNGGGGTRTLTGLKCRVCAYRIMTPDVCLDKSFTTLVKNGRPEECVRFKYKGCCGEDKGESDSGSGFLNGVVKIGRVLTVGDGDLSFSVGVKRLMDDKLSSGDKEEVGDGEEGSGKKKKKSKIEYAEATTSYNAEDCNVGRSVTATSYEKMSTLEACYGQDMIKSYVSELGLNNSRFQVDATRLGPTLGGLSGGGVGVIRRYDSVVWNFPCTAEEGGQDGQNGEMDKNKTLLTEFTTSVMGLLEVRGEVVVSHKTKPPYNQWDVRGIITKAGSPELVCKGRVVFDRSLFHPYVNRKALDRKSFSCGDAEFYVFEKVGIDDNKGDTQDEEWGKRRGLVRIDADMIDRIRQGLLLANS